MGLEKLAFNRSLIVKIADENKIEYKRSVFAQPIFILRWCFIVIMT